MEIRHSTINDLDTILLIYKHARDFMKSTNNPNQWKDDKPSIEQIKTDIINNKSYVCIHENEIVGVFFFDINIDKTYNFIEGEWLNETKYGVVHRIAVYKNKIGVGSFCLNYAFSKCHNLRIDTHEDNYVMQNLLSKLGFVKCGIIYLENNEPRLAFQKIN